jgi:hypothetical protein
VVCRFKRNVDWASGFYQCRKRAGQLAAPGDSNVAWLPGVRCAGRNASGPACTRTRRGYQGTFALELQQ